MNFLAESSRIARPLRVAATVAVIALAGCGTTKSYTATEQLLLSDAVDSTITKIDFRPLAGQKVYLETKFAAGANKTNQGATESRLVNSDYVISAVRQQLMAAGCLLVEERDKCDLVVEMRLGALGADAHNILYGIPSMNLGGATNLITGVQAIPTIPELALAKRDSRSAAAKVALFAYQKDTMEPYWQSGIAQAGSSARDSWWLGIGPFQSGTIYPATRFAGRRMRDRIGLPDPKSPVPAEVDPVNGIDHRSQYVFQQGDGETETAIAAGEAPQTVPAQAAANDGRTPAQLPQMQQPQ